MMEILKRINIPGLNYYHSFNISKDICMKIYAEINEFMTKFRKNEVKQYIYFCFILYE